MLRARNEKNLVSKLCCFIVTLPLLLTFWGEKGDTLHLNGIWQKKGTKNQKLIHIFLAKKNYNYHFYKGLIFLIIFNITKIF
jgi:hypothetical protein